MSIKSILLNLNDLENLDALLETGCALGVRHSAHLIGVYAIPSVLVFPGYYGSGMAIGMAEIISTQHDKFKAEAEKVKAKFEEALRRNMLQGEWRQLDSPTPDIANTVIEQARAVDLVIIAQVEEDRDCGVENGFVENIILESGRPVLIVPRLKVFPNIGKNVVIGWNRSQEATRASFDLLPMLNDKSEVNLVWVDPQKQTQKAGHVPGADLAEAFAHHGIHVSVGPLQTSPEQSVGAALLQWAHDHDADLLVMGAYGHSRMREMVFGGATRYVLDNMNVPVLMSC